MRDSMTFTSERLDNRLVAVGRGFDTHNRPVEFVMDPLAMLTNLEGLTRMLHDLVSLARLFWAMITGGFSGDNAWALVEPMLPRPVQMRTALDQAS
jgi:hypothetical protein